MADDKRDVLLVGPSKPVIVEGLSGAFKLHKLDEASDRDSFLATLAGRLRAIAVSATTTAVDASFMSRLPRLEIVSTFGVGYDHVDAKWAGAHGITVTNTPDVLNEEVADTAIGLLLCTAREFCQAERYVRAGKWRERGYPLSKATLRDRTVGIVGMGRIGRAIARRLEAFGVPIVYHTRRALPDVAYRHYPHLIDMAHDVDVLMLILPGGAATQNMVNAEVLEALGPNGILINMARGSVVDESALVEALRQGKILSAGLDVVAREPEVPKELLAMDNVVIFPHVGSASVFTRTKMDQLVVDNLVAWSRGEPPLTPVAETPWPPRKPA